jgi:hypothetical protein
MPEPVEPPAVDERWGDTVQPASGDWDREYWLALARDVYGLDAELLAERSTAWIVGRVGEERPRFYGGETA